jgi:hypothetical protein
LRTPSLEISLKLAHYITTAAILLKILYGSQVLESGNTISITSILSTYKQIARWITGLLHSTQTSKLLAYANLPPLEVMLIL